ncbi:unnamed protein product [Penicillium egyptiacum]|uniref:Uncharacterized protein n=1 Tax=Penicillium egyptiacum TaxID=1303716 RepID=A0A9W4KBZ8_9EURO|nr:unnamed protein product [Penicillium egyptiacum]
MDKAAKKVRTESSSDSGILEECKKEVTCDLCDRINWTTPSKGVQTTPPPRTVAIVVDVVQNRGAIRIFEKESGEYIDGVGTEEEGFRIIIPWRDTWRFRASGVVEVGYIVAKDAD